MELLARDVGVPEQLPQFWKGLSLQLPTSSGRKFKVLDPVSNLSNEGCNLVVGLLQWDPAKRWTAKQALACSYFQEAPLPLPKSAMPKRFQV